MGKVIKFNDHLVKGEWLTVGQDIAMFHWIKWKVQYRRRMEAAQKEEADNKKPRLVSPK